ncbi:MAG: hypothetical protein R3B70_22515 [Polyangiaceae bacterium]
MRYGEVLSGQTRIWVGGVWGSGCIGRGVSVAFVLDAGSPGICDTVKLGCPAGQVVGHEVVIGEIGCG